MSGLARLVGVRPGEGERVALTVTVGFVAAAGLMIGGSAIEAIYFSGNGVDGLPVLYVLLGCSMFVATVGFTALLDAVGRGRACLAIPLVLAALAGVGRLALIGGPGWVAPALWLLQAIAQFLVNLAVWGVAGIVTDTRQAKRFFPLIGAGVVLGYVLGGLATKPLASVLGTENLLLVWIGSLLIVVAVGARVVTIGDGWSHRRSRRRPRAPGLVRVPGRGVRAPLVRDAVDGARIAALLLLFFSLYLPFSGAAAQRFPDPDELAGFFGVFFGLSTGLAFVLSLVVTNRLLARFGVPVVLLVLPILYVVSFGALTVRGSFTALLIARFAQVAWLQGGAVSALEAVTNTVPADRRDQTRAFLYGGPTQVGTIAAGAIALVQEALTAGMRFGIALVAALLATVAMLGVRRQYPRELVRALREGRPSVFAATPEPTDPLGLSREDRTAADAATSALVDPDPRMRRIGAYVVADLEVPGRTEALIGALDDDDPDVRAIAIGSLARAEAVDAIDAVARHTSDADPRVRVAAVRAIGALSDDPARLTRLLATPVRDADDLVRAEAAGVLVHDRADPDAAALLLSLVGADRAPVRAASFRGLAGFDDTVVVDAALAGLGDPDPRVRIEAARTLPESTEVTERLVGALRDHERRDGVLMALGMRADEDLRGPIRAAAMTMVDDALERGAQSIAFTGRDDPRSTLLHDSLTSLADREARAAIRTVGALDGGPELSVALDNLSLTDDARRANALEVLDGVGDHEIVRPLLALWEGGQEQPRQRSAVVVALIDDPDPWIRACARFATRGPDRDDETGGTMGETATTLSPMERVLFLREVPLFASLPPADLLPIATIAEERSFVEGDRLAARGDPGDEMYIVVSGHVDVSVEADDGPARIATRRPGDVIGEMALLTGRPRVADLTASDDVRALSIARPQFESILRERPETALAVIAVLCERLEESQAGPPPSDAAGS